MQRAASVSTIPDTAAYLGMSTSELTTLIDHGELAVVHPHGQPMIHEADLEDFIGRGIRHRPARDRRFARAVVRHGAVAIGLLSMATPVVLG